jgi:aromatic ring-opening dioxygenase LigB subunit
MAWIWAAYMPHPPIIVPGVGGGREREAAATLKGLSDVLDRIRERVPDRILLLSPHQPYAFGAFAVNTSSLIKGGLSAFGTAEANFELHVPISCADLLTEYLGSKDIPTGIAESGDLSRDNGSCVPLYFLRKCYGNLPDVILSSPIGLDREMSVKLGGVLASFDDGKKWGLLASGDLSHRLKPGAPAGFSPAGEKFDKATVEALELTDPAPLMSLSPHSIEEAGECGMRSALAMLGLVSKLGGRIDVLSYEGPFGVGYCNAVWTN